MVYDIYDLGKMNICIYLHLFLLFVLNFLDFMACGYNEVGRNDLSTLCKSSSLLGNLSDLPYVKANRPCDQ